MRDIRWGIIGLGRIAAKFAETLIRMDGVVLEGVASRAKERAEAFGKLYEVPSSKCYGSYENKISSP